jgi:sulfate adenylyltransferase
MITIDYTKYPTIILDDRQLCDLELLCNDSYFPLKGYMKKNDYNFCLNNMTLEDGTIWGLPITLPIDQSTKEIIEKFDYVILKNETLLPLAIMDIRSNDSIYEYNVDIETTKAYGTTDTNHPYVNIINNTYKFKNKKYYVGGDIIEYNDVPHYDFNSIRLSPKQVKEYFKENNWTTIVGFQTRNPLHKSHYELTKYALKQAGEDSKLLLHPVVGITQECDVNYHTRVRCYKQILEYYPENTVKLSLLNLSMRMAGPREAVHHAIIRKNYGCTHFVVGRDHAGPSYKKADGSSFYDPYEAQDLLLSVSDKIGIKVIISKMIVYAEPKEGGNGIYKSIDEIDKSKYNIKTLSGTEQRDLLVKGLTPPEWFSFSSVVNELKYDYVDTNKMGLCLYIVGLSGSGKSTLANAFICKFKERILGRPVTLLDADIIRQNLSKGLGFTKQDRSTNVRRIGYLCSEIVKHRGVVVVANIAPYKEDRLVNNNLISQFGHYVQVFVNTSINECEKRDCKGLYKKARSGDIKEFTGVSDPFEEPNESSIILDECNDTETNVNIIIEKLLDNSMI